MPVSDAAPVASAPPPRERELPRSAAATAPVRDTVSISPAAQEVGAIERELRARQAVRASGADQA